MVAKLYKELEITEKATQKDIKKAYHRLARKYHPDKNPNNKEAETKFKKVSNAYELLSDENDRRRYDANEIDEQGQPVAVLSQEFSNATNSDF